LLLLAMLWSCSALLAQPQQFFNPTYEPFYHGVASGDPLTDRVIIWSRVTTQEPTVNVEWQMALDPEFTQVVATGNLDTDASRDYTVKIDVAGLAPNTTYYYVFKAFGKYSLIGRTKTAPAAAVDQLKFVLISCSNFNWGYFNVYDRIADRNDLDAVIHVGDYIYEYPEGVYEDPRLPDRITFPNDETNTLDEYRARYSLYRLNNELIRAHQQHPFITTWDDHEIANDGYIDGAENHDPSEGDWEDRKAQATQAYFEWLPIRDNGTQQVYRSFSYEDLADLMVLDTRFEGRSVQFTSMLQPGFDDMRTMLGETQKAWLFNKLSNSNARWKVIAQQVMFSPFNVGFGAGAQLTNPDSVFALESFFLDIWDGYPAERQQIVDYITDNNLDNVVILSGDIHSSFANDVVTQPAIYPAPQFQYLPVPNPAYDPLTGLGSAAVEFVTPSVSAANFDENLGAGASAQFEFITNNPIEIPQGSGNFFNYNPHMKHVDLDRNGYVLVDLQEGQAQGNYYYVPTVLEPSSDEAFGKGAFTNARDNFLTASDEASPPKAIQQTPAPALPPTFGNNETARVQLIHAAQNQTVEVQVNGATALPIFAYLTATPYLELPAGQPLTIDLIPIGGPTPETAIETFQVQFAAGESYVVAAHGTFDPNDNIPVELAVYEAAQESADNEQNVALLFFHGASDAPGVDVQTGGTILFDDVSFGNFAATYQSVPAAAYELEVTPQANNQDILQSYASFFSFWKGKSAVIFATGQLGDGTFQPWVALSNGGTYPLFPSTSNASLRQQNAANEHAADAPQLLVIDAFPNPTTGQNTLKYMLNQAGQVQIDILNLQGKRIKKVFEGQLQPGPYQLTEDLSQLPKGTYFYLISINEQVYTHQLILH
ncbi:MAG: alkaline phosphatase D family protein, partial [Bacteroidota bacterium]